MQIANYYIYTYLFSFKENRILFPDREESDEIDRMHNLYVFDLNTEKPKDKNEDDNKDDDPEEGENPFEKEPTEDDITKIHVPDEPADDILDDDEVPYN